MVFKSGINEIHFFDYPINSAFNVDLMRSISEVLIRMTTFKILYINFMVLK